jgi:hypothetical protein
LRRLRGIAKKLSEDAQLLYELILENPGITMITCATYLRKTHSIYGMQKAATLAIAELRRAGLIVDCPRCPYCGRALSRARRNVPLYAVSAFKLPKQPLLL